MVYKIYRRISYINNIIKIFDNNYDLLREGDKKWSV